MAVQLHLIAEDLDQHAWYGELESRLVADVEAFVGRWAAFEDFVAAFGRTAPDTGEEPR